MVDPPKNSPTSAITVCEVTGYRSDKDEVVHIECETRRRQMRQDVVTDTQANAKTNTNVNTNTNTHSRDEPQDKKADKRTVYYWNRRHLSPFSDAYCVALILTTFQLRFPISMHKFPSPNSIKLQGTMNTLGTVGEGG